LKVLTTLAEFYIANKQEQSEWVVLPVPFLLLHIEKRQIHSGFYVSTYLSFHILKFFYFLTIFNIWQVLSFSF